MAYGILKKRYLNALREAPPPLSYEDRVAAQMADEQLIGMLATLSPTLYSYLCVCVSPVPVIDSADLTECLHSLCCCVLL